MVEAPATMQIRESGSVETMVLFCSVERSWVVSSDAVDIGNEKET